MKRFRWADHPDEQDIGGPVDARPGVILSRRRFVSLAIYTSAAVVLSGARATPVEAAPSIEPLARGTAACMPAVRSPEPPLEVIPYEELEQLHLLYRDAPKA